MQSRAVRVVQPVAWVERQQRDLGTLRKGRRLIKHEPARVHPRHDRHASSVTPERLPNKRMKPAAFGAVVASSAQPGAAALAQALGAQPGFIKGETR